MKAEHRKELQTNVLADRMGRLVQNLKTKPQKRSVMIWLLVIGVVVGLAIWWYVRNNARRTDSALWLRLDKGHGEDFQLLISKEFDKTPQGRAARFAYGWFLFWEGHPIFVKDKASGRMMIDYYEGGVKNLASHELARKKALDGIRKAQGVFAHLAEECKDDPIWGPEAFYTIAVIEETFAMEKDSVENIKKRLDAARVRFEDVAEKFPKSARAKDAAKRAQELKDKTESRKNIEVFYRDFSGPGDATMRALREINERLEKQRQNKQK